MIRKNARLMTQGRAWRPARVTGGSSRKLRPRAFAKIFGPVRPGLNSADVPEPPNLSLQKTYECSSARTTAHRANSLGPMSNTQNVRINLKRYFF